MKILSTLKHHLISRHRYELSEGHVGGFTKRRASPQTWCPEVWDWAVDELGVRSVLDVGCGRGFTSEYFASRGCDVLGIDGSEKAIESTRIPGRAHLHDFEKGAFEPERRFDLVWSAEFVEHVYERYLPNWLRTFSYADRFVFITYAVPGQGGHHHVNEQPREYWIERLAEIDFAIDEEATAKAISLLPPRGRRGLHFRERGLVFRRC